MAKRTHIYALHDPRDWSIRYVGKAHDPRRRMLNHFKHPKGEGVRKFVSELRSLGLSLRFSILQQCSDESWAHWERFWIATVRASGAELLNIAPGGNAPITSRESCRAARIGKKDSVETRLNKSLAAKGKKKSPEHIAKAAAAQLGRKFSEEHKAKIAAAHVGMKQSPETVAKRSAKMASIIKTPEYRAKMSAAASKRWSALKS
jgi:GIY-YIG catalytic domain